MKRQSIFAIVLLTFGVGFAKAGEVTIGLLSFDVFIPSSGAAAGINSFDVFNLTGPSYGPAVGPPYASDPLTFDSASLTLNFSSGSSESISLGDISPGELLDSSGNPIVQFPSTDDFSSAVFTATLTPTTFTLSDGTTFAASGDITADLTPSSGSALVAGTDFAVINAESAPVISAAESSPFLSFLLVDLLTISAFLWWKRASFHFR